MKGLAFVKDPDGYLIEILPQGPMSAKPLTRGVPAGRRGTRTTPSGGRGSSPGRGASRGPRGPHGVWRTINYFLRGVRFRACCVRHEAALPDAHGHRHPDIPPMSSTTSDMRVGMKGRTSPDAPSGR